MGILPLVSAGATLEILEEPTLVVLGLREEEREPRVSPLEAGVDVTVPNAGILPDVLVDKRRSEKRIVHHHLPSSFSL
jgi:hypothetical protein